MSSPSKKNYFPFRSRKKREKRITWLEAFHLLKRVALRRYRIKYFSDDGEQAAIRDVANKESGQELEHASVPNRTKKTSKKAITSSVNSLDYQNFQISELDTYELNDNNLAEIILTNIVEEIKSRSNSTTESSPHTSRQSKRKISVGSGKESDQKDSNKLENFKPYKMVMLNNHAKNPNGNIIDKLKKIESSCLNHQSTDKLSKQRPLVSINGSKFIQTKAFQLENSIIVNNANNNSNVKPKEWSNLADTSEKKKFQNEINNKKNQLDDPNFRRNNLPEPKKSKAIIGPEKDSVNQEKQTVLDDKTDKNRNKASNESIDSNTVITLLNQEAKKKPQIQIDKATNLFEKKEKSLEKKKYGQKILTNSNKTLIPEDQELSRRMPANNREIKVKPENQKINGVNQSIKNIPEHETTTEQLKFSSQMPVENKYKSQIVQEKNLNKIIEEKRLMKQNIPTKPTISIEKRYLANIKKSKISKNHSKLKIREKIIKVFKQPNLLTRDDLDKLSKPTKLKSIKEENSKNFLKQSIEQSKRLTKPKKGASKFKTIKRRLRKNIKKDNKVIKRENKFESEKSKSKQGNSIDNLPASIDKILPSYENNDNQKVNPIFLESNNTFVETISGTSIHDSDVNYSANSENEFQYKGKEFSLNLDNYEQVQNECINLEDNEHDQNIVNNQISDDALIKRLKYDLSDTLNIIDEEEAIDTEVMVEIDQELNYPNKHESFLDRTSTPKSDLEKKYKNEQDKTESESHDKSLEFQSIRNEIKDKTQESIKIFDEIVSKADEISQPLEADQAARDDEPVIEELIELAEPVDEQSSSEYDEAVNDFLNENEKTLEEQVENKLLNERNKIRENSEDIINIFENIPNIFVEQSTIKTLLDEEVLKAQIKNEQDNQVSFQDYKEEIQINLDSEIIDVKPTDEIEYSSRNTPLTPDSFSVSENESNDFEKNEINSDYNLSMFEKFLSHNKNNINLNKKRKSEVPSPLLFSMKGFYDDSSSDEDLNSDSKIKYSSCALQARRFNRK